MKTKTQYEQEQERICREQWFPNHIVARYPFKQIGIPEGQVLAVMGFRNPATGIYAVRYIIDRNKLIVTGDIGHAIFRWSDGVSFEWLATCGLHYFAEKCECSENGKCFTYWNEQVARHGINEIAKTLEKEGEENALSGIDMETKEDCRSWLWRHWEDHNLEPETCASIVEAGMILNSRCIGMWVGLKMAVEQLKA